MLPSTSPLFGNNPGHDLTITFVQKGSGNYRLTDKWGNRTDFDAQGCPAAAVDRNANTDTLTYNGAYQMTGYTDDRGKSYTPSSNSRGYMTALADPANRSWSFGYDGADNLTTVTTPSTADQTSGITVTLGYDQYNRLTGVTDGRGNHGLGDRVLGDEPEGVRDHDRRALDRPTRYFGTGRTDRTDRNGNVSRTFFSGNQVSKKCLYVHPTEKYITLFNYSGAFPSYTVLPRGNRVDYTFDSAGNMTARRHRTQDTSTNDSSDILRPVGLHVELPDVLHRSAREPVDATAATRAGNLTSVTHPTVTNPASQSASISITCNSKGQATRFTNEEGYFRDITYHASGSDNDLVDEIEEDAAGLSITRSVHIRRRGQRRDRESTRRQLARRPTVGQPAPADRRRRRRSSLSLPGPAPLRRQREPDLDRRREHRQGRQRRLREPVAHDEPDVHEHGRPRDARRGDRRLDDPDDVLRLRLQPEPDPRHEARGEQGQVDLQQPRPRGEPDHGRGGDRGVDGGVHLRRQREPDGRGGRPRQRLDRDVRPLRPEDAGHGPARPLHGLRVRQERPRHEGDEEEQLGRGAPAGDLLLRRARAALEDVGALQGPVADLLGRRDDHRAAEDRAGEDGHEPAQQEHDVHLRRRAAAHGHHGRDGELDLVHARRAPGTGRPGRSRRRTGRRTSRTATARPTTSWTGCSPASRSTGTTRRTSSRRRTSTIPGRTSSSRSTRWATRPGGRSTGSAA